MHGAANKQSGLSLIEVLITVVLVSIGLLGLAGLQLMTVQNTNSAAERFEATTLARNILERMRANRQQARNGDYNLVLGAAPGGSGLVGDDQTAWLGSLGVLPAGQGAIDVDAAGIVTIEVQWTDASDDNAGASRDMSVFLRTEL
ncbi:MAG: type IV pilus modification protein PilV [Gammaproteobacteria bacterium PRO9]|nr:type IV pilus modification protein PilV [Gammaproteobacteria bacterium PRO9]